MDRMFGLPGSGAEDSTLSVVVPTRNERDNIRPLLGRLASLELKALRKVIFVDDSDDDTPEIIAAAAADSDLTVELIHRPPEMRKGGLGSAVISGFQAAGTEYACVLDGDLQHPPERIPALWLTAEIWPADVVVATRYAGTGTSQGLSGPRRAVSRIAGALPRLLFPRRFKSITDAMSGFFMVRLGALDLDTLSGNGFKILAEILATNPHLRTAEVPFEFGLRQTGDTKASASEGFRYLKSLSELRLRRVRGRYRYDIHGILAVDSDTWLPELAAFRQRTLDRPANVVVRTGLKRTLLHSDHITYREILGNAGFAVQMIRTSGGVDVAVSNLVAASPHVLYTNVVEPVLRWLLAERGYALVHAACIEVDGDAFFITARTDTGKTTTMLKILDGSEEFRFIADDLTIVDRVGRVLPYPKPLTISAHTLHAVKRARLSRKQRLGLPLQSRLHSKSGRKIGLSIAETRLPAATMNAAVQKLIPPPKYDIHALVPEAETSASARVRGLFIIQRGDAHESEIGHAEAMDILLENCEDAYGFPPYHAIAPFLRNGEILDLADAERETIQRAFAGAPARVIQSSTLDWAERIPDLIARLRCEGSDRMASV